jgi:hypothetical protein
MSKEVFIKKYLETNNKETYSLPIYLNRFDGNSNLGKITNITEDNEDLEEFKNLIINNKINIFSFKNLNGEEFNFPVKIEKLTSEEMENDFNISDVNREDYKMEIFFINEGLLQNLFQNEEETSEVTQYKKHLERFITPGMYQENKSLSNVVKLETGQYVTVLADGTIISN